MSLKDIDLEQAFRRLAERRIEEAMREGKFSNLAGAGRPLNLEPMPADENARLTWWCLRILKNNEFTPEEIRFRKSIDYLKTALQSAQDEQKVSSLVDQINELVRKLNTLGTNAMNLGVAPIDKEAELQRFRRRRSA